MTSDALVKAILTEETCELYDRDRIKNLFKNIIKGYGKVNVFDEYISITYASNKSRRVIYHIPKLVLTDKQLSVASTFIK